MIDLGPILPPPAIEPAPGILPIWPPVPLLAHWPCPLCGIILANGTMIGYSPKGLAHANCGAEG